MKALKKGFYTALGTPLDREGNIVAESLAKEIEMQIDAGASGLLLMGSMGMQATIKDDAYVETVRVAAEANKGRIPLLVGAMDNSIARVNDRIDAIKGYDIDAVVLTTPYYEVTGEESLVKFFEAIADHSPLPVFLYDLPSVTQQKINFGMVKKLAEHKNIVGIKSGDLTLARLIKRAGLDFEVLCSNLDCFDVAVAYGIDKLLDGMFAACPVNGKKLTEAISAGDLSACSDCVDNIVYLRNIFIEYDVFPSFAVAMNRLGMEGSFSLDYLDQLSDVNGEKIAEAMRRIGEIE